MKRKTFYAAAFAAMGLLVTGCQKENEEKMLSHSSVAVSTYIVDLPTGNYFVALSRGDGFSIKKDLIIY